MVVVVIVFGDNGDGDDVGIVDVDVVFCDNGDDDGFDDDDVVVVVIVFWIRMLLW